MLGVPELAGLRLGLHAGAEVAPRLAGADLGCVLRSPALLGRVHLGGLLGSPVFAPAIFETHFPNAFILFLLVPYLAAKASTPRSPLRLARLGRVGRVGLLLVALGRHAGSEVRVQLPGADQLRDSPCSSPSGSGREPPRTPLPGRASRSPVPQTGSSSWSPHLLLSVLPPGRRCSSADLAGSDVNNLGTEPDQPVRLYPSAPARGVASSSRRRGWTSRDRPAP